MPEVEPNNYAEAMAEFPYNDANPSDVDTEYSVRHSPWTGVRNL